MAGKGERHDFKNPVINWVDERLPLFTMMHKEYAQFPTPKNFNYFWNFGAISMGMLMLMIITGIVLAMHYVASHELAFDRIEYIMRDVNYGWLIRYLHMNGASFFFIAVYIHVFRGLYYGSYKKPRELLWIMGVVILLLMMATAFMGYVLPWGQMSYYGAKVITSFFQAVPYIGQDLVIWIWGEPTVGDATLNRFFSLHYLLPFVILGVVFLHVVALHITGSNNPIGVEPKTSKDTIPFHPYYTSKDVFGFSVFLIVFCLFVFYAPNFLGHPDNYVPANPMQTPAHIVPEWYFLPFYAILRAVPDINLIVFTITAQQAGVIALFASVLILMFMPWLDQSEVKSARFRPWYRLAVIIFAIDCMILGYVGAQSASDNFWKMVGQIGTVYYFAHFLIIVPLIAKYEKTKPLPASIHDAVLKNK